MSGQRILVYRNGSYPGLGHTLFAILNYARYAYATGRVFALDMREFRYLPDPSGLAFFDYFTLDFPDDLALITDLAAIDRLYCGPEIRVWTKIEELASDHPEPVVVIPGINPPHDLVARMPDTGRFRIGLTEMAEVASGVDPDAASRAAGRIGVHFRHGNGERLHRRFDAHRPGDHETGVDFLKQRYLEEIGRFRAELGDRFAGLFVASDNAGFRAALGGDGEAAATAGGVDGVDFKTALAREAVPGSAMLAAIADIWALSACEYLVCGDSYFSAFARANSDTLSAERTAIVRDLDLLSDLSEGIEERHLEEARAAVRAYPEHVELLGDCIKVFQAFGLMEEALDLAATRARVVAMGADHYWNPCIVDTLVGAGERDRAMALLWRAVDEFPETPSAYLQLVRLLDREGRREEADRLARRALAEVKRTVLSLPELIRLQRRLGDPDALSALSEAALAAYPDSPEIALEVGHTRVSAGDLAGAEPLVRAGLRVGDRPARAHFLMARILKARGRFAEALVHAREAERLDPDNPKRLPFIAAIEEDQRARGIGSRLKRLFGGGR